jgi:excisionase family DNA binding protein
MLSDARVMNLSELSGYLRVHRSTVYRLLKRGALPGFKIGSDWRFNIEAIDDWRMHQSATQWDALRADGVEHYAGATPTGVNQNRRY